MQTAKAYLAELAARLTADGFADQLEPAVAAIVATVVIDVEEPSATWSIFQPSPEPFARRTLDGPPGRV